MCFDRDMGLFDRMSNLVSANLNALLDRAEDPKKTLDLAVAEMGEHILRGKRELVDSLASEKQAEKRVAELDAEAEVWTKRAELAMKADDEPLAREALTKRRAIVAERDRAEALLSEARAVSAELRHDLSRMEEKRAEVEAHKGVLAARVAQAAAGGGAAGLGVTGGRNPVAEFERLERDIERDAGRAEASREVDAALGGDRDDAATAGAFRDLEAKARDRELDDELAALRQRVRLKP